MARKRTCTKCGHVNAADASECAQCAVIFRDIRGKDRERHIPDACEYVTAMQERCHYPAAVSPSTTGGGPWYCRFHFYDRHSSIADHMVEASRDYVAAAPPEAIPEEQEAGARAVAERFGVDPNAPPKERFYAALTASGALKKAISPRRRDRVPGEDDEPMSASA